MQNASVSHAESAHTKLLNLKPRRINRYEKTRGRSTTEAASRTTVSGKHLLNKSRVECFFHRVRRRSGCFRRGLFGLLQRDGESKHDMYWMVTNRNVTSTGFGDDFADISYWQNNSATVDVFSAWKQLTAAAFQQALVQAAITFPDPDTTPSEDQESTSTFSSTDSIPVGPRRWGATGKSSPISFAGPQSLGECILFTWPSKGTRAGLLSR